MPNPFQPPVTASVTNAAGLGPVLLKQSTKIVFTGALITPATLSYALALPAQFKLAATGKRAAKLLMTVRSDAGLPPDQALAQWSQRVATLTAIVRNAGLPDTRFLFGLEPGGL